MRSEQEWSPCGAQASEGLSAYGTGLLLVVAHPDDEAMFFSPLLWYCVGKSIPVAMVSLSTGNFNGLGATRAAEFHLSAAVFGIDPRLVFVLDRPDLQDGMNNNWPVALVADAVLECVDLLEHNFNFHVSIICSFDEYGVSGHPNHIATFHGTSLAQSRLRGRADRNHEPLKCYDHNLEKNDSSRVLESPKGVVMWKLKSTSLVRKYIGVVDLFFSLCSRLTQKLTNRNHVRSKRRVDDDHDCPQSSQKLSSARTEAFQQMSSLNVVGTFRAMSCHLSQLVWYRVFFILFSRYTYVNDFQVVE
jgi:N-acetylglucosaminylphosphatidylinositol deacetylase